MASKLLNVLNDIERGRQQCITNLNTLDFGLNKNSSFFEIASSLSNITPSPKEAVNIPENNYTVENDPDLYHTPNDFPDIKEIFIQCEDIKIDGRTYYPLNIFLFASNLDTFHLFTNSTLENVNTQLEEGTIKMGYTTNSTGSYDYHKYLKFSDGGSIVFGNNATEEIDYTWDTSKDIITGDNKHLRYIIVYGCDGGYTANYTGGQYNFTGVDLYECITTTYFGFCAGSQSGTNIINQAIGGKKDSFGKLTCMSPFTPVAIKRKMYSGSTGNYYGYAKTIILDFTDTNGVYTSNEAINFSITNTVRMFSILNNNGTAPNIGNMSNILIYLKAKSVSGLSCGTLRYLYINPEIQKHTTIVNRIYAPSLKDTNLIENIKAISGVGAYENYFGINMTTINMDSLETISGSNSRILQSASDVVSLPKLQSIESSQNISYINTTVLSIPNLEQMPFALSFNENVKYISLPSLRSLDFSLTLPTRTIYLDISGLEETGVTRTISGSNLRWLILPSDFKINFVLQSNVYLTKECLLDILNKCATLEEGESYTLTLGSYNINKLTDEEIAIATNKGWTVN